MVYKYNIAHRRKEYLNLLTIINLISGVLLALFLAYQWIYVLLNFIKKPKRFPKADPQKYAVLISARNESNVIGNLINSIKKQDYPQELIDIYVIADNCTDNTADVAKEAGAIVYERFNTELVGKGFALNEMIHHIWNTVGQGVYNGYFVFDADNLLDINYISEMNNAFCAGNRAVTSYRNSKNFSDNWISACSGTWLLRESGQWNCARTMLGISSSMPGTGFLVAESMIIEDGGFISETMTEDIEFTYRWVARGERVAHCDDAIYYDEQPTSLKTSFNQLLRWSKGNIQCYIKYIGKLLKGCFSKNVLSCLDILLAILPAIVISLITLVVNLVVGIDLLQKGELDLLGIIPTLLLGLTSGYVMMFLMSLLVMITENHRINCSWPKRILYSFCFPIYTVFYAFAVICSLFTKVKWKPIEHKSTATIDDMKK